uniref:Uncharacterized protein n=1 Tax=Chlamydomonas euryale TaxID=1486919 RepID=A0A6U2H4R0_9CHLO|mmetsp:Transcript_36925/g.108878  ORF Transcript_36925/g.108878 Transcript_36925/m.108878 type:complete len:103 (+) Transcript_36925:481-789(+)
MHHQVVEVSASSAPKDVVGAIVSSAAPPPKPPNTPVRFFQLALAFILVFACVIYFREEIYTFSTVRNRPILEAVENEQVQSQLGGNWQVTSIPSDGNTSAAL